MCLFRSSTTAQPDGLQSKTEAAQNSPTNGHAPRGGSPTNHNPAHAPGDGSPTNHSPAAADRKLSELDVSKSSPASSPRAQSSSGRLDFLLGGGGGESGGTDKMGCGTPDTETEHGSLFQSLQSLDYVQVRTRSWRGKKDHAVLVNFCLFLAYTFLATFPWLLHQKPEPNPNAV
jgi:hypothetical protein